MFCSQCGKEIQNTNTFCPYCGEKVNTAPAAPVYQPQQAPVEPPVAEPVQVQPPVYQEVPVQYPQGEQASYQQYPSFTPYYVQPVPQPASGKSKKGLILGIVIPCAAVLTTVIVLLVSVIIKGSAKAELQEKLLRDWSRVEKNDSIYYTLILDFSEDEIVYSFDSTYVDRTISTYEYEVISGDTIEVEGFGEVKVTFNDDETMMTFTPSITDTEPRQYWYNFD